jgi:hypothetical protein
MADVKKLLWQCPKCKRILPRFEGEANITCPECGLKFEAIVQDGEKVKTLTKLED